MTWNDLLLLPFISILFTQIHVNDSINSDSIVSSISCYKCFSINGSNPSCDDLFQGDLPGNSSLLNAPCWTHLRGRQGFFPATHCIKLVAYSTGPEPVRYVYRTCGRDEAEDNGIARASHCGFVKLDWIDPHRRFRGCLHICNRDACNRQSTLSDFSMSHLTFFFIVIFRKLFNYFQ